MATLKEWRARLCALASLMFIAGCASGCGTTGEAAAGVETQLHAETSAEATPQSGGDASAKAGNLQEDELQSRKDKLLVVSFAALLQLDKKAGLAITAAEAQAMLPIVRRGEEQGELSLSEQKALDDTLTVEQAKFVADFRSSVDRHRESRKELTPQQREAMIARFEEQQREREAAAGGAAGFGGSAAAGAGKPADSVGTGSAGEAGSGKPDGGDDAADAGEAANAGAVKPGGDAAGAGGGSSTSSSAGADLLNGTKRGGDRTIEQQLIDVLESKLPSAGATSPTQSH